MEKKLTLDRKEGEIAFFIDSESELYKFDLALIPSSLREGDVCIVCFNDDGGFLSCKPCDDETKNKKAEMRTRLFGLFKNKK